MTHSVFLKGMAIGMMRCGRSARSVANDLNVTHRTVSLWWRRWNIEGNLERKRGSGRPRKTHNRTDRKLVIAAKRNRFTSIPRLTVSWKFASRIDCSVRTAYRRLAEAGLKSYRPAVRIPLSKFLSANFLKTCLEFCLTFQVKSIGKSGWTGAWNIPSGAGMTGGRFSGAMNPDLHWISMMAESVCTGCLVRDILSAAFQNTIVTAAAAS